MTNVKDFKKWAQGVVDRAKVKPDSVTSHRRRKPRRRRKSVRKKRRLTYAPKG